MDFSFDPFEIWEVGDTHLLIETFRRKLREFCGVKNVN